MPRIRTLATKRAPKGFENLEPQLQQFQEAMREAVNAPHENLRKNEALWPIMKIERARNQYIYDLYYKEKKISRELYDWLVAEQYANQALIGKWRKPGFERLCCLKCIQPKDSNQGTACICRVPSNDLHARGIIKCTHCGCTGCASGDQNRVIIGRKKPTKDIAAATGDLSGGAGLDAGGLLGAAGASSNLFSYDDEDDEDAVGCIPVLE